MRVNIHDWFILNLPGFDFLYYHDFKNQVMWVRDTLPLALASSSEEYSQLMNRIVVIATFNSKSIKLPVYQLTMLNGTIVTFSNNFDVWAVSVNSPIEIMLDPFNMFDPTSKEPKENFHGFPRELVYGNYQSNKEQFSFVTRDHYTLYATLLAIYTAQLKA